MADSLMHTACLLCGKHAVSVPWDLEGLPYANYSYCPDCIHKAIKLLKEQETEWEHLWDAPDGTFKGRCKKCGFVHFFIEGHDEQYKFCPECGMAVKWE